MQFRLSSAQECTHLVTVLQQRGMEFQQQRPRTGRPATARSDTASSGMRPLTVQSAISGAKRSLGSAVATQPSPFQMQALEAGGLSSQQAGSNPTPQASAISRQLSQSRSSFGITSMMNGSATTSAPVTAIAPSLPAPDIRPLWDQSKHLTHDLNSSQGHRDLPASRAELHFAHQMANKATSDHALGDPATDSSSTAVLSDQSRSDTLRVVPDGSEITSTNQYENQRCSSAVSLRMPETLEHEMPPRRELPFKRAGSHQSTDSRPSSKARPALRPMTTNGPSKSASITSMLSSTKKPVASRPVTASPLKRPNMSRDEQQAKKTATTGNHPKTSMPSDTPAGRVTSTSTLAHEDALRGILGRPSDIGELLRNARPLAERSPNSKLPVREDSTADAPYELETPPQTSNSAKKTPANASSGTLRDDEGANTQKVQKTNGTGTAAIPPSRADGSTNALDQVTSAARELNPGMDASSLATYASQSTEDRQSVLDEFMVARLEDPNFAILCEDLDSCWRRIALGL